jgi:mannose-6-phosphate isomerase-like protein (cupin superfamily)
VTVNLDRVLDAVTQPWSPHVVAVLNDYDVKVAWVEGAFTEHAHDETDELFVVLAGRLWIDLPDRTVELGPHDVCTVPRGVRHRPRAEPGTRILLVEPRGTVNTGDASTGTAGVRLVDDGPRGPQP